MKVDIKNTDKRYMFFAIREKDYLTLPVDSAMNDHKKLDAIFDKRCHHFIIRYRTIETPPYFIHMN